MLSRDGYKADLESMVTVHLFVSLFFLLNSYLLGHAGTIQWYRTAQGTSDRLTKQADLSFGEDFASNATLVVDR